MTGRLDNRRLTVAVQRRSRDHAVLVRLIGMVDMSTASHMRERTAEACALAPSSTLVIDLTGVTFLASAGLAVLLRIRDRCLTQNTRLQIVATDPSVIRIFELAGVTELLPVVATIADAWREHSS